MSDFSPRSTWRRITSTRAQLDAILDGSRPLRGLTPELFANLTILRGELQDDLDLQDDLRYSVMFSTLRDGHLLHSRLLHSALYSPASIGYSRPYPLYASELSLLTSYLGFSVAAKTIERLADDGLISPPLLIGTASLPRPIYFARHLLEVLYEQVVLGLNPARAKAYLDVLAGRLDTPTVLYFRGLRGVRSDLLLLSVATSRHAPDKGAEIT